jgi:hypothetical protein
LGFLDDKYLQPNHNSKRNSLILSFLATNKIVRAIDGLRVRYLLASMIISSLLIVLM